MSRNERRTVLDLTQRRIEAFNEAKGGGVGVRKHARGYTLFIELTGMPLARLRPVGDGRFYDVLFWSYRERWKAIGDFGGVRLPLDEALQFIAEDPMGCFWH